MDKQTNVPVNTRTIGAPEGIYILYLEDYVHTFIKKISAYKKAPDASGGKAGEYQVETAAPPEIALYGRCLEENGRYRIVVSGAAILDDSSRVQQLNDTYFPTCTYIGSTAVSLNKDSGLRLELTLRSTKVILDDFYIYYDQNDEMQNYLVEWNANRENKVVLSPAEHDAMPRNGVSDAAHLGRIAQAYNREEAKVSFMWNVMNVLCLGFVVCVMAYGIISINNYNKMQNMQASIDYCMAYLAENFPVSPKNPDGGQLQAVQTMQQNVQAENERAADTTAGDTPEESTAAETSGTQAAAEPQDSPQTVAETQEIPQTVPEIQDSPQTVPEPQDSPQTVAEPQDTPQTVAEPQDAPQELSAAATAERTDTPQYYVVRKGDTLRTICIEIYGDYSRVDEVCRWNNIEDPDNILYGQKLLLP